MPVSIDGATVGAGVTVVLATISPSKDDVKVGVLSYKFCEPVLLRRWMYGTESDQPYPTMPSSVF